jgi:tetratricopeptide repeat protein 21B
MEINVAESYVYFYMRHRMWQNLADHCEASFRKLQDNAFIFWKGFAYHGLNDTNESINQLTAIQSKRDVAFAAVSALLFYNQKTATVDREAVESLRQKERDERKVASDKAVALAVHFYVQVDEPRRAKDLLDEKASQGLQFRLASAFYAFSQGLEQEAKSLYEDIFAGRDKVAPSIEIYFGKVRSMAGMGKPSDTETIEAALEVVNEAIVHYPEFVPLQLQRCELLIMLNEWEQFGETIGGVIAVEQDNLLSLKFYIFQLLVRDGNIDTAYFKIKEFEALVEKRESLNGELVHQAVQLFIRVCGRHPRILQACLKLIAKCRSISPLNANYVIEHARAQLMLGNLKEAYSSYQEAGALDESKVESISGMIECKIRLGEVEDIESQIEFLNEMMVSVGRTPDIAYLEALLSVHRSNSPESIAASLRFIDNTLKMQIAIVKSLPPGFSFYVKLNPDFLFSIAELYFHHIDMGQMLGGAVSAAPDSHCGKGLKLLNTIIEQIPGFLPAHLLRAKGRLASGNWAEAMASIGKVLALDPKNDEAYIMQAMTLNKKGEHGPALLSLQEAISKNFQIRENPLFMLIKGEIEFSKKDFEAAQATMEAAYALPGVKDNLVSINSSFKIVAFSERDRCSIFLLLAKVYACLKQDKQSKAVMNEAISEFAGTQEEVNVMLANASIALEEGDVKKAISILKTVTPASPYFVEGKKMLAEIYLTRMRNRRQYAKCYSDIIDSSPSLENYKLLGDALLHINEPEDAAGVFEKAHELNPSHEGIIRDLGRAYSLSHEYGKAIAFYERKIKELQGRIDLKIDLARLYVMLLKFREARAILPMESFFSQEDTFKSLKSMKLAVEGFVLLGSL